LENFVFVLVLLLVLVLDNGIFKIAFRKVP